MLDPNPQPVELVYTDSSILVCIKPAGVVSTDQPGGLPDLLRQQLGDTGIRTVHRLDQVVSGLMVLARTPEAAGELSRQIRAQTFAKEYLAVIHGRPAQAQGKLRDLLLRNKEERKTYVVNSAGCASSWKPAAPTRFAPNSPPGERRWWGTGNMAARRTAAPLPCGLAAWPFAIPQPVSP